MLPNYLITRTSILIIMLVLLFFNFHTYNEKNALKNKYETLLNYSFESKFKNELENYIEKQNKMNNNVSTIINIKITRHVNITMSIKNKTYSRTYVEHIDNGTYFHMINSCVFIDATRVNNLFDRYYINALNVSHMILFS